MIYIYIYIQYHQYHEIVIGCRLVFPAQPSQAKAACVWGSHALLAILPPVAGSSGGFHGLYDLYGLKMLDISEKTENMT